MVITEQLSVMPFVISSQRSDRKTAPECLTRLQSMEVDRGSTLDLSVIIAGFPSPQVTWSLDDDVISETNERFIFKCDETQNKHSLIITHITRQQEGVYRCTARNCEGSCSTMGFITVKEMIKKRKKKISRKPNIATIREWRSQEEKEHDPDGDTFVVRNKHCWDWWNLEAMSDNEEVFEKSEPVTPCFPSKPLAFQGRENDAASSCRDTKVVHIRKQFVRAKSAEPESNLSRRKSTSLPDVHKGLVENKYKKLLGFWEQITAKKK